MSNPGWVELTMIDNGEQRQLLIKKSWIVGIVDMGPHASYPTALLLGNHGLPMVSIKEPVDYIMNQLETQ